MPTTAPPLDAPTEHDYRRAMLALGKRLVEQRADERRAANVGEYTQSVIAILVVATTCGGVAALSTWRPDVRMPPEWWTICGLVIGFYFGRNPRPTAAPPATRNPGARERATDAGQAPAPPPS